MFWTQTVNKLKIQKIHKLNSIQKSKQHKIQQNKITLVQSPLTTISQKTRWAHTHKATIHKTYHIHAQQWDMTEILTKSTKLTLIHSKLNKCTSIATWPCLISNTFQYITNNSSCKITDIWHHAMWFAYLYCIFLASSLPTWIARLSRPG